MNVLVNYHKDSAYKRGEVTLTSINSKLCPFVTLIKYIHCMPIFQFLQINHD